MLKNYEADHLKLEMHQIKDNMRELDRDIAVCEKNIRERSEGDDLADMEYLNKHKSALAAYQRAVTERAKWLGIIV